MKITFQIFSDWGQRAELRQKKRCRLVEQKIHAIGFAKIFILFILNGTQKLSLFSFKAKSIAMIPPEKFLVLLRQKNKRYF